MKRLLLLLLSGILVSSLSCSLWSAPKIAFVNTKNNHLWIMDIAGKKLKELEGQSSCSSPLWSPNGEWLAYCKTVKNSEKQQWCLISPADYTIITLHEPADSVGDLSWSPDSTSVIFSYKKSQQTANAKLCQFWIKKKLTKTIAFAKEPLRPLCFWDNKTVLYATHSKAVLYDLNSRQSVRKTIPKVVYPDYVASKIGGRIGDLALFQIDAEFGVNSYAFVPFGTNQNSWVQFYYYQIQKNLPKNSYNIAKMIVAPDKRSVYALFSNANVVYMGEASKGQSRIYQITPKGAKLLFKFFGELVEDFNILNQNQLILDLMEVTEEENARCSLWMYDIKSGRKTLLVDNATDCAVSR